MRHLSTKTNSSGGETEVLDWFRLKFEFEMDKIQRELDVWKRLNSLHLFDGILLVLRQCLLVPLAKSFRCLVG